MCSGELSQTFLPSSPQKLQLVTSPSSIPQHLYPFEGCFLRRGELKYHYLDEGQGDPIVMVHGNPSWSIYYRRLIWGMRDTHRCIVPDHIGCGFSEKPSDENYGYRLRDRVKDLEALIEETTGGEQKLTLVAHDWGGMIAMAYAVQNPARIGRIVLLNTAAFHLPASMRLPKAIAAVRNTQLGALSVRGLNSFSRAAANVGCKRNPMSAELRDAYCAPYDSWDNRIATLRFVQDIPLSPQDPSYALVSEVEAGLHQFNHTPILLCWGMLDFVFGPQVLLEFQKRWPHAEVEQFDDCGHYVLEDAGEEAVARIRAFVSAHPLPKSA